MPFWSPETSILLPNYHSHQFSEESGKRLYEAIDDCRPKTNKLMKLYLKEIQTLAPSQRVILAGDDTPWPRTEAPTLKDRTYEHGAKVISGKPITLGHGYSTSRLDTRR